MNLEPLQSNKPYFIEEFQSGEIQILSRPCTFSKYLLAHATAHLDIFAISL
jgi:hypothetical protein